ncbi:hypothetical protein CPC08DRAFT_211227 [Agrocybe pediades]|nr:hypothetical protein CPC08DRAFT_211227 [Agrocybe pediades]
MLPRSTMILSTQGVLVSGGQFTQNNNYNGQASSGSKAALDILMEAVASNALHDSGATFDKPKCHPRTRVKIRDIILRWILGEDEDGRAGKQFMWLNGAAGCGKSAIAQSTVESCIEQGLPFASFFFGKSDSTRNHVGSLIATLAYQLYCAFRGTEVQKDILSAIQEDPLVFKKTIQQQFTSLIIRPLMTHFSKGQSAQHPVPFLIVIDGLDECTDRNAQKAILTGLAESLRNSNLRIPVFVASRPEHEIKLSFGSKCLKDMHTPLSLGRDKYDAYSDISLYLTDRFAEIKDDFDNRTTGRKLVQDWPGNEAIRELIWSSSGQFIYAATVIRYVESTRHRPDHRLEVVLNVRPVNGEHPLAQLDSLYTMILESVLDVEKVLHVLSLFFMYFSPKIGFSGIETMLSYDEGEVETLFCDLGALVEIYEEKEQLYLRFLHASFREYLGDAARSKQFYIDEDYKVISYITLALQYLASCCSSFFDPTLTSFPGPVLSSLDHILHYQMVQHHNHIILSLDFQQAVLSFPLKELLEPHSTSRCAYGKLLQDFVTPFLELIEVMVIKDPTLSYIQDHQLGILRSILMRQIQQYYNDDKLAAALVLFYHMGSHRFVPVVYDAEMLTPWIAFPAPFYMLRDFDEVDDVLFLLGIWEDSRADYLFGDNVYHRFVRQVLRDTLAGQSAEYALGPIVHSRAALPCFKELARRAPPPPPSPSGKNIDIALVTDDAEDDAHEDLDFWPVTSNTGDIYGGNFANLVFDSPNGGQWLFRYIEGYYARKDCPGSDDDDMCFLLLGYLIFLLPRCGRSDALISACKDYTRLPDDPESYLQYLYGRFPVRRRLFHNEINRYLARVSQNIMSEI